MTQQSAKVSAGQAGHRNERRCGIRTPDAELGSRLLMVCRLYHHPLDACQHQGKDVGQGLRPPGPSGQLVPIRLQVLGLVGPCLPGQLGHGGLQVLAHLGRVGAVFQVERQEFAQQIVVGLPARVRKQLPAGDHGEGQARKGLGELDAQPARVFAQAAPLVGAGPEVMVTVGQVGGGLLGSATA